MVSITDSSVTIQTSAQSVPSIPSWFGEITLIAHYLKHLGLLATLAEKVRFARSRFGQYDTVDFVVVLLGYAISGERTLEAFYKHFKPLCHRVHGPLRALSPPSSLHAQPFPRSP